MTEVANNEMNDWNKVTGKKLMTIGINLLTLGSFIYVSASVSTSHFSYE